MISHRETTTIKFRVLKKSLVKNLMEVGKFEINEGGLANRL